MNFEAFLRWSGEVAVNSPAVRRHGETRIAAAFADQRPTVEIPRELPPVHRCDLARHWCALQGLPATWSTRAMACEGVRQALDLLLRRFAREGVRVTLPGDVYPVYWQIAAATCVDTLRIETFPEFELLTILAAAERAGSPVVVLPAPLKLQGRPWSTTEAEVAAAWLRADGARRLILDGVYAFGQSPDPAVRMLLDTGQVIYLDSLSKGWLYPRHLGFALLPESEMQPCADAFRQLQLRPLQLFLARELLLRHPDLPKRLEAMLARRRRAFAEFAVNAALAVTSPPRGYLIPVHQPARDLLRRHRLLAIPASVFGSARSDWSIVSVLPARAS